MRATGNNLTTGRPHRQQGDFVVPADLIPEILGSWEMEVGRFSPEMDAAILKAGIKRWMIQRLPLFAGRAA